MTNAASPSFAASVVRWQRQFGRRDLPWQGTREPYRVWLSEIMLQQTQVKTALPYYTRFLERFPNVAALARAHEDEILALWSGLGYYSRARNLHRCARQIVADHDGQFPRTAQALETLPGIGRSTAAAIAAFCFDERVPILDGNVKRLLARAEGIDADLSAAPNLAALWQRAQALLPQCPADMPAYTQGLMDLGAAVCTPRKPDCTACPLAARCVARQSGQIERFPAKSRRLQRKTVALWLLLATDDAHNIWLTQRPPKGIWARLHCLPVFESQAALLAALEPAVAQTARQWPAFKHVLTHRDLWLHIVQTRWPAGHAPDAQGAWYAKADGLALGLPAPVRKL
ncbi:MAG: A/G-specific adenine glycosylase, partial [Burkholderiaceae bacterium]|nr:A/G-specific adenine glycosylase [Burkholderiaceae bacterium]